MNVQLRPELEEFVREKVKAGEYASTEEMVEAGIARLMLDPDPELNEETLEALEEGEAQGDRGEIESWSELRRELAAKYLKK
jgi:putative addiction module CopG family antidote